MLGNAETVGCSGLTSCSVISWRCILTRIDLDRTTVQFEVASELGVLFLGTLKRVHKSERAIKVEQ